jgi:hypothetical protein
VHLAIRELQVLQESLSAIYVAVWDGIAGYHDIFSHTPGAYEKTMHFPHGFRAKIKIHD